MSRTLILALPVRAGDADVFLRPPWESRWSRVVRGGQKRLADELGACLRLRPGTAVPELTGGSTALWVSEIDQLEQALADPVWDTIVFEPTPAAMLDALSEQRRVLIARRRLSVGHVLGDQDVVAVVGGPGLPEAMLTEVIGCVLCYDLNEGEPITFGMIAAADNGAAPPRSGAKARAPDSDPD